MPLPGLLPSLSPRPAGKEPEALCLLSGEASPVLLVLLPVLCQDQSQLAAALPEGGYGRPALEATAEESKKAGEGGIFFMSTRTPKIRRPTFSPCLQAPILPRGLGGGVTGWVVGVVYCRESFS